MIIFLVDTVKLLAQNGVDPSFIFNFEEKKTKEGTIYYKKEYDKKS